MKDGLIETIRAFDEFYQGKFSEGELPKQYGELKKWIGKEEKYRWIPREIRAMDNLLGVLERKDTEKIRKYLEARENRNTMTCGYYDMPVEGYNFFFHNETIPDHFGGYLTLYGAWSTMPFYEMFKEGVTTPFFLNLKFHGKQILKKCYDIKKQIFATDEGFMDWRYGYPNYTEAVTTYLLGEADRLEAVQEIAKDMKSVYGIVTQIIDGMGKK